MGISGRYQLARCVVEGLQHTHRLLSDPLSMSASQPRPAPESDQNSSEEVEEEEESALGSSEDEQEDPEDYCRGTCTCL